MRGILVTIQASFFATRGRARDASASPQLHLDVKLKYKTGAAPPSAWDMCELLTIGIKYGPHCLTALWADMWSQRTFIFLSIYTFIRTKSYKYNFVNFYLKIDFTSSLSFHSSQM